MKETIYKMFVTTCCGLLLALLSGTGLAGTGDDAAGSTKDLTALSPEELMKIEVLTVIGASKYEQKVTEAPSSVSIITAEEIKKYGYRTVADILRSIRSFYITHDRNYSYGGVRGFGRPGDYNTRILLLVDGHRINDNIYNSALIGTEFILDVDLIDRVEVIRGPGSSLYGSNAFFAVVNVITKSGRDFKGMEISGAAVSFDTYTGRLSYGNKFQTGLEMLLSDSIYDSKGQRLYFREFDDPATNNGVAENSDYDRYHNFFTKLSYQDFTLEGAYVSRKKGIPTASFGALFNDPRTFTVDEQRYLDLKYEHNFPSQIDVMARVFYGYYHYHGDYIFDYPPITLNKDFSKGEWWGGELKFTTKLMSRHKVIVGTEYQNNVKQHQGNYDEEPYFRYLDDRRKSWNWALYLQDEFPIVKNLILNLGMRYDYYPDFEATTNPRLALIYSPFEKTTFKLLYGEAFRAPTVFELYYNDGGISTKSNPDLKPEKIKTYELVCEQYIGDHLRISADGFYYEIKDLISQQTDSADNLLVFRNVEEIEAEGFELELESKWANGLEGRISYTYQEAEDKQTGKLLTNLPEHLTKLNLIIPLLKEKLFTGVEEQFTSKRETLAGNNTDAFFVTNLTLFSQNMVKGLDVSASVYNLFNEKYVDPGSGEHLQDVIEQDGRAFRFKITYKF